MTLPTGYYTIVSKATKSQVGRAKHEDLSMLPKPIIVLPQGAAPSRPWVIVKGESSHTNVYTIRASGDPAINIDGKLFAELLDPEIGKNVWKIHAQPHHGENIFTIVSAHDESIGWVVPNEEPDTQLDVKVLTSTKSLPPQFPPNELFDIIRILEE